MPIYEYECEQCGVRFERLQRMSDAALTVCPECSGHIHRVMQPVGIIFKGSGFYVTDNRGKSSTSMPPKKKEDEGKSAGEHAGGEHAGSEHAGGEHGAAAASTPSASTTTPAASTSTESKPASSSS
jgi:putative FmdB family regulatory protein